MSEQRDATFALEREVMRQCEHIVFSPHFDDAALSCGGQIARLSAEGARVGVVTVFAGETDPAGWSPFARHLADKWSITTIMDRRQEDVSGLEILGVHEVDHWDVADAPYRSDGQGLPLYGSYAAIQGDVAATDRETARVLAEHVGRHVAQYASSTSLYFPLALGNHVDHQLLFREGLRLSGEGRRVLFYEEWPYVEGYVPASTEDWHGTVCAIQLGQKIRAVQAYRSQLGGLGGSPEAAAARIEAYGMRVGRDWPAERYWQVSPAAMERLRAGILPEAPYRRRPERGTIGRVSYPVIRAVRALSRRVTQQRMR